MSEKIFISIASFKDPLIARTIKSLLKRAENPHNIRIVVLDQVGLTPEEVRPQNSKNVEVITYAAKTSKGTSWARSLIQNKYDGEKYVLELDSHMMCKDGWDTFYKGLLNKLKDESSDKPVISSNPPAIVWDDVNKQRTFNQHGLTLWENLRFDEKEIDYRIIKKRINFDSKVATNVPWIDTRFIFSFGDRIETVPNNPKIYQTLQDDLSIRLYTHGYDVFASPSNPIAHSYDNDRVKHIRLMEDRRGLSNSTFLWNRSINEFYSVIQGKNTFNKKYSLGQERSVENFEKFAKINYNEKIIYNGESDD